MSTPAPAPAPLPISAPGPDQEDLDLFREEASTHADVLIAALDSARQQPDLPEGWEQARKSFHTLKGAALTIGLKRIGDFVSEAEKVTMDAATHPAKRQGKRAEILLLATRRMFVNLDIRITEPEAQPPVAEIPDTSPPSETIEPSEPAEPISPSPATTSPPSSPSSPSTPIDAVSAIISASDTLDHWKHHPDTESKTTFNTAVEHCRQLAGEASSDQLATSFRHLREFTESVHENLPPLAYTVVRKALDDARLYLREIEDNPHLTWNRKWGFYFSSLRIALASEATGEEVAPSGKSGKSDPTHPDRSQPEIDPEMIEVFIEEAGGLYDPIESAIMQWEQGHDEKEQKASLRRHFHTLKGAANSVGLRSLGSDFHALEDYMESLDTEQTPDTLFSFLLRCLDEIRNYVEAIESNPNTPWSGTWAAGIKTLESGQAGEAGKSAEPSDSAPDDPASSPAPTPPREAATLRVDADQLRNLMNLITEMIADRHRFQDNLHSLSALHRAMAQAQNSSDGTYSPKNIQPWSQSLSQVLERFKEDTLSFNRQSKQIQSELAEMNMGPVSTLFRRLSRSFRDACQEEEKEATWTTGGENTQLDRTVLEHLYGPLLHVVRNAVAHGIEAPDRREANGKPRSGSVHISATPQSNQVILEITDDGAGINGEAVLKRGLERGLVPPGTTSLTHDEVVGLLFTPGFSTKEQVSSVAGRGVGLDVVKGAIETLNGSVGVHYEVGKGTTWRIKVPLSLTASEALLVSVADRHLAIPLSYIDTCIQLKPDAITRHDDRALIRLQDETLPYLDLTETLNLPSDQAITHGVIVDSGIDRAVLGVQGLHSRREVVVKDLGPFLESFSLYSGVTADTDGSLIPILQVPNLLQTFTREFGTASAPEESTPAQEDEENEPTSGENEPTLGESTPSDDRPIRVLLADDSPSVRKIQDRELTKYGFQVTLAEDGASALAQLENNPFDLLITDWEMPNLDGEGLIRSLRHHSDEHLKKLPVIVISSRVDDAFAAHAREIGAQLALPKPFDTHAFHQAIQASDTIKHLAQHAADHPAVKR